MPICVFVFYPIRCCCLACPCRILSPRLCRCCFLSRFPILSPRPLRLKMLASSTLRQTLRQSAAHAVEAQRSASRPVRTSKTSRQCFSNRSRRTPSDWPLSPCCSSRRSAGSKHWKCRSVGSVSEQNGRSAENVPEKTGRTDAPRQTTAEHKKSVLIARCSKP